jgi:hypothetical protein
VAHGGEASAEERSIGEDGHGDPGRVLGYAVNGDRRESDRAGHPEVYGRTETATLAPNPRHTQGSVNARKNKLCDTCDT